ncbi:MAG: hypothetical protein AB7S68_19930 [Polyangiaceae bacterium]
MPSLSKAPSIARATQRLSPDPYAFMQREPRATDDDPASQQRGPALLSLFAQRTPAFRHLKLPEPRQIGFQASNLVLECVARSGGRTIALLLGRRFPFVWEHYFQEFHVVDLSSGKTLNRDPWLSNEPQPSCSKSGIAEGDDHYEWRQGLASARRVASEKQPPACDQGVCQLPPSVRIEVNGSTPVTLRWFPGGNKVWLDPTDAFAGTSSLNFDPKLVVRRLGPEQAELWEVDYRRRSATRLLKPGECPNPEFYERDGPLILVYCHGDVGLLAIHPTSRRIIDYRYRGASTLRWVSNTQLVGVRNVLEPTREVVLYDLPR